MATSTEKVSVSIDAKELRWVKALSRRTRSSVSALINEAIRRLREEREREVAQQALLAQFAPSERASAAEMEAIRAEWRG
jgi:Arc/MetJ-type ribon-helix-helix transcriptional regulator